MDICVYGYMGHMGTWDVHVYVEVYVYVLVYVSVHVYMFFAYLDYVCMYMYMSCAYVYVHVRVYVQCFCVCTLHSFAAVYSYYNGLRGAVHLEQVLVRPTAEGRPVFVSALSALDPSCSGLWEFSEERFCPM